MSDFLLIEAAGGAKPKVIGLAYSGGKMNLPGWKHPVVVDLSGLELPESVPLLANHQNKTASRVGMVTASVKDNVLEIDGQIVSESEDARDIVAQSKAGADWQLSIGADVVKAELVRSSREVNGQIFEGPFYHVQHSTLREISVVAVGADAKTTMKVSASFNLQPQNITGEGTTMANEDPKKEPENKKNEQENKTSKPENTPEKKPENKEPKEEPKPKQEPTAKETPKTKEEPKIKEEPKTEPKTEAAATPPTIQAQARDAAQQAVRAERERVSEIQTICNGDYPEIEREAISAGWEPERVTAKVLKALRDNRPSADVNISVKSKPEGGEMRKTLEAAMCMRVGISGDSLIAEYGEQTVHRGDEVSDIPLKQLLLECLRIEGVTVPAAFGNDTIHAAFSTVSLPGILSNVANKKLLHSYKAQPVIATRLCSTGDLNDFKENERFRLTDAGDLQPIGADGEIKEGGLSEEKATNQLDTYGKKFCLTRKMIINDDLGAFMKVPTAMGNRAARLIDQLFFSRLLSNPGQSDGKALFSEAHGNLLSGADSALAHEGLRKAVQMFLDQVDSDGQPINIEPRYLLVPTGLKHPAIELTKGATLIVSGGDATEGALPTIRPALNSLADENLQVVSSPYLANNNYSGSSSAAWYLFGDPATVDTFECGFLKGKRTPTVERGSTDFNTLGLWFRVYFDLGVREQDHRGMVKAAGA